MLRSPPLPSTATSGPKQSGTRPSVPRALAAAQQHYHSQQQFDVARDVARRRELVVAKAFGGGGGASDSTKKEERARILEADKSSAVTAVRRFFDLLNARDISGTFNLLAEDVNYVNTALQAQHEGRQAVARFYVGVLSGLPQEARLVLRDVAVAEAPEPAVHTLSSRGHALAGTRRVSVSWSLEIAGVPVLASGGAGLYRVDPSRGLITELRDDPQAPLQVLLPALTMLTPVMNATLPMLRPVLSTLTSTSAQSHDEPTAALHTQSPGRARNQLRQQGTERAQPLLFSQASAAQATRSASPAPTTPSFSSFSSVSPSASPPPSSPPPPASSTTSPRPGSKHRSISMRPLGSSASPPPPPSPHTSFTANNSGTARAAPFEEQPQFVGSWASQGSSPSPSPQPQHASHVQQQQQQPATSRTSTLPRATPASAPSSSRSWWGGATTTITIQQQQQQRAEQLVVESVFIVPPLPEEQSGPVQVASFEDVTATTTSRDGDSSNASGSSMWSRSESTSPPPLPREPRAHKLEDLTGVWQKDPEVSQPEEYERMLDALGLSGIQRVTARLIEGMEIKVSKEAFSVSFLTIVPFFRVSETIKFGAQPTSLMRRDLRAGRQQATAVPMSQADASSAGGAGGLRVTFVWPSPSGGQLVELYELVPGDRTRLAVTSILDMADGRKARVVQMYTRSQGSREDLLKRSAERNGSMEQVLSRQRQRWGRE